MKLYWLLIIPFAIVVWLIYRAIPCGEARYTVMSNEHMPVPADIFWESE